MIKAKKFLKFLPPVLLFVPYPTQLSPGIRLQVVDRAGQGIPCTLGTWQGDFYASGFEKRVSTDANGRLTLPPRSVWMPPIARIGHALESLLPHNGFIASYAAVYFSLPAGFELAVGGAGSASDPANHPNDWDGVWSVREENDSDHPGGKLLILVADPTSRHSTGLYYLVVRHVVPDPSARPGTEQRLSDE